VSQTSLNYQLSGSGQNLVLLHGFLEDLSMWFPLFSDEKNRVLAIDLFGHGSSSFKKEVAPSITFMAQQVADLIKELEIEDAVIIGHSLGGYVALELANLIPFKQIVLFHSHPWEDSVEKQQDRERVAKLVLTKKSFFINEAIPNLFFNPQQVADEVANYISIANRMHAEAIAWTSIAMQKRGDKTLQMKQISEKYTVIGGSNDRLIPIEQMRAFCMDSGIHFIEIQETGHMSHVEKITEVKTTFKHLLKNI
jgi:pimeloyl-ACP methyl ester carboxylesterase